MSDATDIVGAVAACFGAVGVVGGAGQYIIARRSERLARGNSVFVRIADQPEPALVVHNYGHLPIYQLLIYIENSPLNGDRPKALGPGEQIVIPAPTKTVDQLTSLLDGDNVKLSFFDSTKKLWEKTNLSPVE